MTHDEFRSILDDVHYSDEFTEKMNKKLSEAPSVSSECGDRVEGAEAVRRSNISRYVRPAAACLAAVVGIGGIGFAMRGAFNSDNDNLASRVNDNIETTANTMTENTTEAPAEPETVPVLDMLISSEIPYADLSGKSGDELLRIGNDYYNAAWELHLMNAGASSALDCDYTKTMDDETDMNFYLVQYDQISSISDAEKLYRSVFSETWEFEEGFFREQDGSLYYSCDNAAYDSIFYEGWDISLIEVTDDKITYQVNAYFNDGEAGSNVQSVPLEFSLIPEDGVWKVLSFIYAAGAPFDEYADLSSSTSDYEIISFARNMLTEAEHYTYALSSPYIGETHFYESASAADVMGRGWAIYGEDNVGEYWLLTNGKTKQELYDEIHSYFTEDYETDFDKIVIERDGKTYVLIQPIDFELFHDYTAMRDDISVKSKSDTEIVLEINSDCTEFVLDFYANGVGLEKLPDDYRYTYPQEVVFVNTENGWRISKYVTHVVHAMESLLHCPEMQPYIDENGNINSDSTPEPTDEAAAETGTEAETEAPTEAPTEDYSPYTGIWTNDNGDKLSIIYMNAETIKFDIEYKDIGCISTKAVRGDPDEAPGISYFNTMDEEGKIGIEGNLYYSEFGMSVYLHQKENENIPTETVFTKKTGEVLVLPGPDFFEN